MRIKRLVAIGLMVLALGVAAPAFAEGPQETPGTGTGNLAVSVEVENKTDGPQETPGSGSDSILLNVIITLATTLVA
ncbi:MAG: hypothetical protein JOZ52_05895 [Acidobacteria bacterium]|nr:hypothetical protein [Acidobacteriota bacterium]